MHLIVPAFTVAIPMTNHHSLFQSPPFSSFHHFCSVGYDYLVFSRPKLYELLLSKIPSHKVHFGKKVLSIRHPPEGGVMIHCSDNSSYLGDIVVGADGAYSAVRQSIYKSLSEKNELPLKDSQGLKIGYMTMVGTTDTLNEAEYEDLKDDFTHFSFIIGKGKPYTVSP